MQNDQAKSESAPEPEGEGAVRSSAVLAVTLSCYEWHELLNELKHGMRFVNRDTSVAVRLFEQIATQLNGARVQVVTANAPASDEYHIDYGPRTETRQTFGTK